MSRLEWIKARQKKRTEDSSERKDSSIWDDYRNIPEFVDSDEDEEDKVPNCYYFFKL